jgi:hypothetical protein
MKRPIGLILSATALSLAGLFFVLLAVSMVFAGISADRHPLIAATPTATPHFYIYLMLAVAVFYATLATWAILTVIGILRLRSWARYSILMIGGGITILSLVAAMGTLLSRTTLSPLSAQQPNADPRILSVVFFVMTALYILVSAVGVWWLIYFNLRPIRELFSLATFPLVEPFVKPDPVPTPIKIIAGFLLLGAVCCLLCIFLPFPAFVLGFILPPTVAHILYVALAGLTSFAGYGLLRLKESARLLTIALLLLGFCNLAMVALPWYQSRLNTYTAQIMQSIPLIPGQPPPPATYSSPLLLFSCIIGLIVYGFVFWLLHRHRAAFRTPPPPEPMLDA